MNNIDCLRKQLCILIEYMIILLLILFATWGHALGEINTDPDCGCVDIRISNISSNNAVISWISPCHAKGEVRYGKNPFSLTSIAFDTRGQDIESSTHYHSLSSLDSDTEYFYQIVQKNEVCSEGSFFTGPNIGLPGFSPTAYGQISYPNGSPFEEGAIIYIKLKTANGVSSLLSKLTIQQGGWYVNLSPRNENLGAYFSFTNDDELLIEGIFGQPCFNGSLITPISKSLGQPDIAQFQMNECPDEVCDGEDNDYDGQVDEDLIRYCSTACGIGVETCDNGQWINCTAPPVEEEIYDGKDNDCDGLVDEDLLQTFYFDEDGDGFGDPNRTTQALNLLPGYIDNPLDCNDSDPNVNPGQIEIRDLSGEYLENFEYGRNLLTVLAPSCYPYTSYDLLEDFKGLGSILELHYKNNKTGFFESTYWFFNKLSGKDIEIPKDSNQEGKNNLYIVNKFNY